MEYNSSTSQTNTIFPRLGYHNVCARQWQGYSQWFISMFLRVRYPEAPSNGSTSIIILCTSSFSSMVGNSVGNAPLAHITLVQSHELFTHYVLQLAFRSLRDGPMIYANKSLDFSDILANLTHFGTEKSWSINTCCILASITTMCVGYLLLQYGAELEPADILNK